MIRLHLSTFYDVESKKVNSILALALQGSGGFETMLVCEISTTTSLDQKCLEYIYLESKHYIVLKDPSIVCAMCVIGWRLIRSEWQKMSSRFSA